MLISMNHEYLQYAGRVDFADPKQPVFLFPATYVRFRLTGRTLKVRLHNAHHLWENRLGVVVNGEQFGVLLDWDADCVIDLSEHLADGVNEVMLFKRQDSCHKVIFHDMEIDGELLPPPERPTRRIEFYGDSVSAGEVTERDDHAGQLDPPDHNARWNNVWHSYAWQAARLLNAEISDIAQGGIALQDGRGWFPPCGMLTAWNTIAYNPHWNDLRPWDFTRWMPHVVVVAIGQNDNAQGDYMHEDYEGELARQWRSDYRRFITQLRATYPRAYILCTTTVMTHSPEWDTAIDSVVAELADERVRHFLYTGNGAVTPGHVRRCEAEKMAQELAAYVETLDNVWED